MHKTVQNFGDSRKASNGLIQSKLKKEKENKNIKTGIAKKPQNQVPRFGLCLFVM